VAVSTLVALSKDRIKDMEYERSISLISQYQDHPTCLSRVFDLETSLTLGVRFSGIETSSFPRFCMWFFADKALDDAICFM
jgi:hypothetical protein